MFRYNFALRQRHLRFFVWTCGPPIHWNERMDGRLFGPTFFSRVANLGISLT